MIRYFRSATLGVLLLALTLTLLTACGAPDGNVEEGARWYKMYNCYACHGKNANDGRAAELAGISMSFGHFVRMLRKPKSPSMPPFPEEKVSKDDAADIYVWLKSLNES